MRKDMKLTPGDILLCADDTYEPHRATSRFFAPGNPLENIAGEYRCGNYLCGLLREFGRYAQVLV